MLTPGAVSHTPISSSGWGYGNGFNRTLSSTVKIAVFAPMPTARVTSVMAVNIGARPSLRRTCLNWSLTDPMSPPRPHSPFASKIRYVHVSREVPGNATVRQARPMFAPARGPAGNLWYLYMEAREGGTNVVP